MAARSTLLPALQCAQLRHLLAGGAQAIVTRNVRDFARTELHFPGVRVVTPANLVKE